VHAALGKRPGKNATRIDSFNAGHDGSASRQNNTPHISQRLIRKETYDDGYECETERGCTVAVKKQLSAHEYLREIVFLCPVTKNPLRKYPGVFAA